MKCAAGCLTLIACVGGKKPPDAAPAPTPVDAAVRRSADAQPAPPRVAFPTVELDGERLAIENALAIPEGRDLRIVLFTSSATCRDDRDLMIDRVQLTISEKLRPDGTRSWTQHGLFADGFMQVGGLGEPLANATIDATPGGKAAFDVAIDLPRGPDQPSIKIIGRLEAEVCPPSSRAPGPGPRPPAQPDAYITVAGQRIPIAGAAYLPREAHGFDLVVSTGEVKCGAGPSWSDLAGSYPDVWLELDYRPGYARPWSASLGGEMIDFTRHASGGGVGLKISPSSPRGETEVTVDLSGSAEIGYPVAWSGTVKAIVCH